MFPGLSDLSMHAGSVILSHGDVLSQCCSRKRLRSSHPGQLQHICH